MAMNNKIVGFLNEYPMQLAEIAQFGRVFRLVKSLFL